LTSQIMQLWILPFYSCRQPHGGYALQPTIWMFLCSKWTAVFTLEGLITFDWLYSECNVSLIFSHYEFLQDKTVMNVQIFITIWIYENTSWHFHQQIRQYKMHKSQNIQFSYCRINSQRRGMLILWYCCCIIKPILVWQTTT
jgi:hypothetical protein